MSADEARGQKTVWSASAEAEPSRPPDSGRIDPAINDTIGRRLQAHYKALAEEPLPDRFLVLLAQLRAKELKQ